MHIETLTSGYILTLPDGKKFAYETPENLTNALKGYLIVQAVPVKLYDIRLIDYDMTKKIHCIKLVREYTGIGLSDAKSFVENIPKNLCIHVTRDKALEISQKFKEDQCNVSIIES